MQEKSGNHCVVLPFFPGPPLLIWRILNHKLSVTSLSFCVSGPCRSTLRSPQIEFPQPKKGPKSINFWSPFSLLFSFFLSLLFHLLFILVYFCVQLHCRDSSDRFWPRLCLSQIEVVRHNNHFQGFPGFSFGVGWSVVSKPKLNLQ